MANQTRAAVAHVGKFRVVRTRFLVRRLLLWLLVWLFWSRALPVSAQTYLQNVGVPSFTTRIPVESGFINAANGNLHLEIPLGAFPQRGGGKVNVALVYDSSIWYVNPSGSIWSPNNVAGSSYSNAGWRLVTSEDPSLFAVGQVESGWCSLEGNYEWITYSPFIYSAPDGTQHSFPARTVEPLYPGECGNSGTPNAAVYASDGSGYYISITNYADATVYAPDGTAMAGTVKTDANGNQYSLTPLGGGSWNLVDTLGRILVNVSVGPGYTPVYYKVTNAQGGTSTYTAKTTSVSVNSNFGQSGASEYSGTIQALSEFDLPDGTKYQFAYDSGTTSGHYGLLTNMWTPNSGEVTYSYANFSDAYGKKSRWITQRTTPDSSTGWSYGGPSVVSSCTSAQVNCQQTVTVTKPSGDNMVYTFTLNGGAWPTEEQIYNGSISSANLLSTTTACYSFVTVTNGQCSYSVTTASPAINVHKLAQTTTLPIPGSSVSATTEFAWDTNNYGNLTTLSEWNFGSSVSGAADRTTSYTYLSGSAYIAANILNRPTSVTVKNSGGATVAQTNSCYDYASGCGSFALVSSFGSATGMTSHDDTHYGATNTVRGDLTQVQRLVSGTSTYLTKSMRYDMTGQLLQATDWSNLSANSTSYSYTDHYVNGNSFGPTNAYPTTITAPLPAGNSTATYYHGTGQLASIADANNETTSFTYNDVLDRLTGVAFPNGGWTLEQYNDSFYFSTTYTGIGSTTPSSSCTSCRRDDVFFDPLGRPFQGELVSDLDGATLSYLFSFDSNGRAYSGAHPYRSSNDPTFGYETSHYDGLDRRIQIVHQDLNSAYTYYGAAVTSTLGQTTQQCSSSTYGKGYPVLMIDEVGNKGQTWTDGFGRLIEVDEADSTGALNKKTCYTYDLNNNRTGVLAADGSQTRSYTYDLLSRLTSQTDPESKSTTTSFAYTASGGGLCSGDPGAICQRTDGRGITTTYTYDAMNRLTGKSYSDTTAAVTYSYDQASYNGLTITNGKGRRTGMSDGSGQTAWSYDAVGNALAVSKKINGQTKTMSYTYNLDGSLATIQYPGGRTITYTTSNAERPTSAKDNSNSINYALSATYAPQGALASMQNGSSLISTLFYNNRLELCRISIKNTGTAPTSCANTTNGNVLDLTYGYGQTSYYGSGSSFNNGNIASVTNNLTSGRTQTYTYDPLNRLLTAQSTATSGADCWGQGFGSYKATPPTLPLADDVLNNQLLVTALKCSSPAPNWSVNSYNQISNTGYTFGNSGGNTADGGTYTYTYDAENRLTSVVTGSGTSCYAYDGNGLRVQKGSASSGCTAPTWNKLYWRDTGGNTIAETDGSGSTTNSSYNEYVFFAGQIIAQSNPSSGNVYYYFTDYLGSTRAVTNAAGSPCYEADFLPYGAENTPSGFTNSCSPNYKFTGYERDPETGNDYAFARYYSQREERFLSPDPLDGDANDPQGLSKYTYARNNPVNLTDPSGLITSGGGPCDVDCGGGEGYGGGDGCDFVCGGCFTAFGCGPGLDPEAGSSLPPPTGPPPSESPNVGPNINPSDGEPSSGNPWTFGCESLGMPCGMQFPGGGVNSPGCDFGACGSSGNGFLPGVALAGVGCVIAEPCGGISVATGILLGLGLATAALATYLWSRSNASNGPKAETAPGVTSGGQATDKYGNKLGPSGKPQINETDSNTREGARNRALDEGSTAVEHASPTAGKPHFQPGDASGNKKPGSTHHNYPN